MIDSLFSLFLVINSKQQERSRNWRWWRGIGVYSPFGTGITRRGIPSSNGPILFGRWDEK